PGDSLGVWAKNNSGLINEILTSVNLNGEERVFINDESKSLRGALEQNLELTLLSKNTIKEVARLASEQEVDENIQNSLKNIISNEYSNYIVSHQFADLLKLSEVKLDAQTLVNLLPKIKPRLYSISSSELANPEEVHITVALHESENANGVRRGAASEYLLQTLREDDSVLIYVEENSRFKLPVEDRPIILVGPGTGVAPFRSFLQERDEQLNKSDSWLFFGNPNFNTDFLYQTEWLQLLKNNKLTKLDVAFSRDQKEKIYVQDKLLQNAEEIWKWLDLNGACFYVCGDLKHMAKDVEKALLNIIRKQGNKTIEDANDYLKQLRKDNRYQRDVY
ncbi:MAG: diflavin oxidoreductase, partial [Kangiellaceae bacterium]